MAKSKRSRRSKRGFSLPLAVIGGMAPLAVHAVDDYRVGGITHVGKGIAARTTGYMIDTGQWEPKWMMQGLVPILIGTGVHKLANRLGVNRAIAGAGIPFIRI